MRLIRLARVSASEERGSVVIAGIISFLFAASAIGSPLPRHWQAKWIAYPYAEPMGNFGKATMPAPVFRKAFELKADVAAAKLRLSGLGFSFFEIDGRRVSDVRLAPAPTQYDVRYRYRTYDLGALRAGRHVLSVTVGDGFYRNGTKTYWQFDSASWTDYPKLAAELVGDDGETLLSTDADWSVRFSPTARCDFRGGETYDARLEFPALETEGADWKPARIVPGPGGIVDEECFPPCRVVATHPMSKLEGTNVWVSPVNISGVPRIRVKGERGAKVTLRSGEFQRWIQADGRTIVTNHIAYGDSPQAEAQRDIYILKGEGDETWAPEFTYHGFDRVCVEIEGRAEVLALDALEVHTDFRPIGRISTSNRLLMAIADAGMRSALNNFVGIPTDCPHREKNGWTSEARLQCETLLYAWDAGDAYLAFVDEMTDAQRPSGQLPGMLPTGGVGYNWGSGPAWDAALACIPESVARFTGDHGAFTRYLPAIRLYCDYVATLLDADGICTFGLGDWCHAPFGERAPDAFVTTAFYVRCLDLAGERARADAARTAILGKFYRGNGVFSVATSVMPALALEFALVPEGDRAACGRELARIVTANRAKVDYGTIGSGCVLRALFEAGYADLAYEMMTQGEMPGYACWINELGLTTFPESWNALRSSSLNHGAFTDIVACCFRYLAGFRHVWDSPGKNYLVVRPSFPKKLNDFAAEHNGWRISWRRVDHGVEGRVDIPQGASGLLCLNGRSDVRLTSGSFAFELTGDELSAGRQK